MLLYRIIEIEVKEDKLNILIKSNSNENGYKTMTLAN